MAGDVITGGSRRRRRGRWWPAAVLVVALAVAARLGTEGHTSGPRSPATHRPATTVAASTGSPVRVFTDVGCVITDHRSRLTLAVAITNLSARTIRLLGVDPLATAGGARPLGVRLGRGTCGRGPVRHDRLPPGGVVVARVSFGLTDACPQHVALGSHLRFLVGGRLQTADVSLVSTDLTRTAFAQCAG